MKVKRILAGFIATVLTFGMMSSLLIADEAENTPEETSAVETTEPEEKETKKPEEEKKPAESKEAEPEETRQKETKAKTSPETAKVSKKNDSTVVNAVEVTLPSAPKAGESIDYSYSVPTDANYQVVTWNNGRMFIDGDVSSGKYVGGDKYKWTVVICPKDGYTLGAYNKINWTIHGIDVNDSAVVEKYQYTSHDAGKAIGIEITFKQLPGPSYNFTETPNSFYREYIGKDIEMHFCFGATTTIKFQKKVDNNWTDISSISVTADQRTAFTVPTESQAGVVYYRLFYNETRKADFTIEWNDASKEIDKVTVSLPGVPTAGSEINPVYSVPADANYTVVTWNDGKLFIYGDTTSGKYVAGETYKWSVVVCPKPGYSLAANDKLNWTVNGVDINDQAVVKSVKRTSHAEGARGIEITFMPVKEKNTLSVKAKTAKVKYKKLKKKNQTLAVSKVITFINRGQGKLVFAKVSGNKKITINKTTGKVTIKKKLKKKTYTVKVKIMASGDDTTIPSGWKTVTFKIKVK